MIETIKLQEKLNIENYIGETITITFLNKTKICGKLLAINEDYFLLNLMNEGFIEVIIFKDAIKHFYQYEI